MNQSQTILLKLVAAAINDSTFLNLSRYNHINWEEIMRIATKQGVVAIALDALNAQTNECRPPKTILLKWFGQVCAMENAYRIHEKEIKNLADIYSDNSYMMMLLKGYGLSKCWPTPEHRPVGDMDIFLGRKDINPSFGQKDTWKQADKMVNEKLGIKVDNSHHHHSVFIYNGISVENHFDFINIYDHLSSRKMERLFKLLAAESYMQSDDYENLYYPSHDFNALFVLKHCSGHFVSTEITIRHLLDWLLYVRKYHDSINWNLLYARLEEFGLERIANIFSTIAVRYLGMQKHLFYGFEENEELVERVLNDILAPEFDEHEDGTILSGIWIKPRRFFHNRWKHRLCYSDSFVSGFIWTTYAKILKPRHFKI